MDTSVNFQNVRKRWVWLSIAQVAILGHLGYYRLLSGHGQSAHFNVLVLVVLAIVIGVWIWTIRLRPQRLALARRHARSIYDVILAGCVVVSLVVGLGSRPEWFYVSLALYVGIFLALIYYTLYGHIAVERRRMFFWSIAGILGIVSILVLRLYMLSRYPPIHIADEPWTYAMAIGYARTGHLTDWIMIERPITVLRFYALMGTWLRLVGEGFWQARLLNLILSIGAVLASAKAAYNFYGRTTAILTALALFSGQMFIYGARTRPEASVMLILATALWLYSEAREKRKTRFHFLVGLIMGLGSMAHYYMPAFGIAMFLGFYVVPSVAHLRIDLQWFRRNTWLYVLGFLLGSTISLALQPMSPEVAQAATKPLRFTWWIIEWPRAAVSSGFFHPELLLVLGSIGASLRRHRTVDKSILVFLLVSWSISSLLNYYYVVALEPFYGLLIGSFFAEGWSHIPQKIRFQHVSVITGLLCLLPGLGMLSAAPLRALWHGESPVIEPRPGVQWVLENIAPSQTVVADHIYFLWLKDYHFVSPLAPNLMTPERRSTYPTLADLWDDVAPDVFILDTTNTSYTLLQPLIEDDYFILRGYTVVFHQGPVTIYARVF